MLFYQIFFVKTYNLLALPVSIRAVSSRPILRCLWPDLDPLMVSSLAPAIEVELVVLIRGLLDKLASVVVVAGAAVALVVVVVFAVLTREPLLN